MFHLIEDLGNDYGDFCYYKLIFLVSNKQNKFPQWLREVFGGQFHILISVK